MAKTSLSDSALNDILESAAYSGHKLSKKTVMELAKLAGKDLLEVEKLRDAFQDKADEKEFRGMRG